MGGQTDFGTGSSSSSPSIDLLDLLQPPHFIDSMSLNTKCDRNIKQRAASSYLYSDRCPSTAFTGTAETFEESFDGRYAEYFANDWCVLHRLCCNGKELAKKIHESVKLNNGPLGNSHKTKPTLGKAAPHIHSMKLHVPARPSR